MVSNFAAEMSLPASPPAQAAHVFALTPPAGASAGRGHGVHAPANRADLLLQQSGLQRYRTDRCAAPGRYRRIYDQRLVDEHAGEAAPLFESSHHFPHTVQFGAVGTHWSSPRRPWRRISTAP